MNWLVLFISAEFPGVYDDDDDDDVPPPPPPDDNEEADTAFALHKFKQKNDSQLSISKGEQLTILREARDWTVVQNENGETGKVPTNYIKRN